jgi:hypothetical protein
VIRHLGENLKRYKPLRLSERPAGSRMTASTAKLVGKRLDRPVEIGARKTKGRIKPVAEPRNYPLSALRKPTSHHSTPGQSLLNFFDEMGRNFESISGIKYLSGANGKHFTGILSSPRQGSFKSDSPAQYTHKA